MRGTSALRRLATVAAVVTLLALSSWAGAKVKGGVVLLPGPDMSEEFTSDLTEVLISALATKADAQIMGKEKLLVALEQASGSTASACIQDPSCLKKVAADAQLKLLVVGSVAKDGEIYNLDAKRVDVTTGQPDLQIVQAKKGDIPDIIGMVKAAAEKLGELPFAFVTIEANVTGAQVFIDDAPAGETPLVEYAVDPGLHHLTIKKTGYTDYKGKFTTKAKKKYVINPKLSFATKKDPPPPTPVADGGGISTMGILAWTSLGVGVLSLGGGGLMGILAKGAFDDLDDACGDGGFCTMTKDDAKSKADDGQGYATISTALLIAGGVLTAGSVVLFVLDPGPPKGKATTDTPGAGALLVPSITPHGAGLDLVVHF